MLKIRYHTSFKKDYKRLIKRGYDTKLIEDIIQNQQAENNCQRKIKIMLLVETILDVENAILHQIGY